MRYWSGIAEWIHELGWLAFLVTVAIWLVNRRLPAWNGQQLARLPLPHQPVRGIAPNPDLVIHTARYGISASTDVDVVDVLRRLIRKNRIDTQVTNDVMGCDPAKGHRKRVRVTYSVGGGPQELREVVEKDRLLLP
jgi:hypothetical protein